MTSPRIPRYIPLLVASVCGAYLIVPAAAQQAAPVASAADLARYDLNKNGVLDPDELAAKRLEQTARDAGASKSHSSDEPVIMSPFEVVANDSGYMASNSASGTRLNSRLEDIASPISVVTKQQLTDLAAVDLNDIFRTEANVEGLYQYSEIGFDRNQVIDTVSNNPEANNRIRGMGQANIAVGGMVVSSAMGLDTYNIDSVEINRGPNSNIFGIGSTSGTVNLNRSSANVQRDINRFSVQADSLGGHRETYDINRVLFKNKLAIRLLGAFQDRGFVRKPSYDKSNRFTGAVRFQPFKRTTLKLSYETVRQRQSLPNNLTPREGVTPWRAAGSYTWDPYNFTVYDAAGNAVHQYSGVASPTTGALAGFGANALSSTYRFNGGVVDSAYQRPTVGYIDGGIAYWTSSGAWLFSSRNSTTQANTYAQTGDQRLVDYSAPAVQIYVPETNPATGQPYGLLSSAFSEQLVAVHGPAGKAFYNWDEYNINASNRAYKAADSLNAELEQTLLSTPHHKLAFQVAGLVEHVTNKSWNFIGNGGDGVQGIVYIDVNRRLPNGDPNPGYLRPYIRARQPQRYDRPEKNTLGKVQVAYLLTMSHNRGWTKWLGDHNFVGYGEQRERSFAPNSLRFKSQLVNTVDGIDRHVGNADSLNTRYYLGDATGFNIDGPTTSPPTSGVFPYTYWSTEFGGTGSVRFDDPKFRTTNARVEEIYFSQGTQKNEIRTEGGIWQGYLLNGRIVPTIGWRGDRTRFKSSRPYTDPRNLYQIPGYPSSTFTDPYPTVFDFNDSYIVTNSRAGLNEKRGQTRTQGVVLKLLPKKDRLSVYYNRSASFDPAFLAIDTYGNIVDDPTGKDESYGVRTNLIEGKLWLSLNRYKNVALNSRNGGANVVAQRAIPFDVRTSVVDPDQEGAGLTSPNQKDLFSWYFFRIFGNSSTAVGQNTNLQPAYNGTGDIGYMQSHNLIGTTNQETFQRVTDHIYDLMDYDKEIVRRRNSAPGAVNTATNDITSKGFELELNYEAKDFSLKVTGSRKETIDSNIAASLTQYIAERMPVLQNAKYTNTATGVTESYWTTVQSSTTGVTHGNGYYSEVLATFNPLVANQGKPRPQVRTYGVAVTPRYQLRGITNNKYLRNLSLGGTISWASKGAIGYGYKLPEADPVTGVYSITQVDPNKPLFDKARWGGSAWARYDFRMYHDRIRSSIQLNVNNVLESHSWLQPVAARTDGQPWAYRIVDPRVYLLTWSVEL